MTHTNHHGYATTGENMVRGSAENTIFSHTLREKGGSRVDPRVRLSRSVYATTRPLHGALIRVTRLVGLLSVIISLACALVLLRMLWGCHANGLLQILFFAEVKEAT